MKFDLRICVSLGFVFAFFSSCNGVDDKVIDYGIDGITEVRIDEVVMLKNPKLSDLVESVDYIPLETSEDVLIGEVSGVIFDENHIFVLDKLSHTIFIFNHEGGLIRKLEKSGQGPEEFSSIESFTINPDEQEVIIAEVGKLIVFNYQGEFVKSFKSNLGGCFQISYTGDNYLAAYMNYIELDEHQGTNHVAILSLKDGRIVSRSIPFERSARVENMTNLFNNFSHLNGTDRALSIPYKPYVWGLSSNDIVPIYYFDFGSQGLPSDYEETYLSNPRYTSSILRDLESRNNWRRIKGGGVLMNKEYLNFSYSERGKFVELYFDKESKKSFKFEVPLLNDIDGTKFVVHRSVFENQFVSVLSASGLIQRDKQGLVQNIEAQEIARKAGIEDNPILRLVRYRRDLD